MAAQTPWSHIQVYTQGGLSRESRDDGEVARRSGREEHFCLSKYAREENFRKRSFARERYDDDFQVLKKNVGIKEQNE